MRPFAPVVEKESNEAFLYEQPLDILKKGNFYHVPLMIGYTTLEGLLFEIAKKVAPGVSKKIHNYEVEIPHDLCLEKGSEKSKDIAAKIEKFYINGNKPDEGILKVGTSILNYFFLLKHSLLRPHSSDETKHSAKESWMGLATTISLNLTWTKKTNTIYSHSEAFLNSFITLICALS